MTPTQRRAYDLHQQGLDQRAIALDLGVSQQRVSQLVLRARHLIEHQDHVDYDCSICMVVSGEAFGSEIADP